MFTSYERDRMNYPYGRVEPRGAANSTVDIVRRRIKVLHVGKFYPPHMGGIETHLQLLCGALRKWTDLQVIVASDDHRMTEEVLDGVCVSRVPTLFNLSSAPICPGMIAKIRASDADIIHLHLPNPTAVLAYLLSRHRGRLVV